MPEPYSNDLRRKFFEVYDRGDGSLKELAKRFRVSESWAKKLSARRSKTGEIEIRRWRHGPPSRVTVAVREWMREQIRRQPDLTLEELQRRLEQAQGLRLSLGWIWVLLRQLGLRFKKIAPCRRTGQRTSTAASARVGRDRLDSDRTAVLSGRKRGHDADDPSLRTGTARRTRARSDTAGPLANPHHAGLNRKRLIEQKVPFIVPGNQMYLPMLAIDLREHFRRIRKETPGISPSTQVVILHALLRKTEQELIPAEMAALLGYSAMTMTRAFDELEAANLAEVNIRGRERCLKFAGDKRELWEKAQPILRSPVNKRLFIRHVEGMDGFVRAGFAALEHYTMLAAPAHPTYALSREEWKAFQKQHKIIEVPAQDPDAVEIEVWWYPPKLFAVDGFVDRLSLLLSLKADHDERTETALEEMMEKFEW